MALSNVQIAEAISTHRFDDAVPYLGAQVRWSMPGGADLDGRDAVVAALTESAAYLETVTTEFHDVRVVDAGDTVVVDAQADYAEPGGERSRVAACDIYDFADGLLVAIRSYNIELADR